MSGQGFNLPLSARLIGIDLANDGCLVDRRRKWQARLL